MQTILKFALRIVVLAVIFYAVTELYSGIRVLGNADATLGITGTYLWIALLFAVVNSLVGPVLRLLSLPFVLLTLGLFLLVVNAALLALTAGLTDRLTIDGFGTAIIGGLILAVAGWVADQLLDR